MITGTASVTDMLSDFRIARDTLIEYRRLAFPPGCVVKFKGDQYCTVANDGDCPPDKLPLRFENGNVWYKPLEECERMPNVRVLPHCVRRMKLRHGGIKAFMWH